METNIIITPDNKVVTQSNSDQFYEEIGDVQRSVVHEHVLLNLNNYMIRESKKKRSKEKGHRSRKIYVLEALRGEEPEQTIRFSFAKE